jgi:Ser/Thr protein kinase RdoA (MazF antagonist)
MQSCEALGMCCVKMSLYHLDPGPGNILLDVDTKMMGVIDFECVGYVPDGWITTEFKVCSGFRLKLL